METLGGVLCFKDVLLVWSKKKCRKLFNPLNNFYCTGNCKRKGKALHSQTDIIMLLLLSLLVTKKSLSTLKAYNNSLYAEEMPMLVSPIKSGHLKHISI